MDHHPRVLLLIPHLGGGGAERVFELLARHLSKDKYELHLGLLTQTPEAVRDFPPSVRVHGLDARRVRGGAVELLLLVRRLRPGVILSTMAHLNFLVLLLRPLFPRGTRVLIRQNGTVSAMLADLRSPALTRLLYRALYRRADRVLCQSRAMAEDLRLHTGTPLPRVAVLPNPIERAGSAADFGWAWSGPGPHLLAVGRLVPQKGMDLLLEAFAGVRRMFPTAELAIAGTGAGESALKARCPALSLNGAVRFAGHVSAPAACFAGATLFVLASRQEGMPNALLEAAAAGLPLVATPASGGLVELLRGQPGVWLADAVSAAALGRALAAALASLCPGERFSHPWIEPFGLERAIPAYEAVIDEALATGSGARP